DAPIPDRADRRAVRAGPAAVGGADRPRARRVATMKHLDTCTVDGCDNVNLNARGLCQTHYSRMLRYGGPRHIETPRLALTGFGWWLGCKRRGYRTAAQPLRDVYGVLPERDV